MAFTPSSLTAGHPQHFLVHVSDPHTVAAPGACMGRWTAKPACGRSFFPDPGCARRSVSFRAGQGRRTSSVADRTAPVPTSSAAEGTGS
jgi:hypothetical protein